MMFFMLIISAPTIIASVDDSIDISALIDLNEEEEQEDIKLLLDFNLEIDAVTVAETLDLGCITYTSKTYSKPHLHLILPPPEMTVF